MLQDYSSLFAIIPSAIASRQLYLMICHNMVYSGSMIFISRSPSYFTLFYKQFIWGPLNWSSIGEQDIDLWSLICCQKWFVCSKFFVITKKKKNLLRSHWSCVIHPNLVCPYSLRTQKNHQESDKLKMFNTLSSSLPLTWVWKRWMTSYLNAQKNWRLCNHGFLLT